MQSILDAAVRYVDSIFQQVWKIIDVKNIILVEILSIILRILQLAEVVAEVEAEVLEEIVHITRKVDTDVPRNIEQDAIEF